MRKILDSIDGILNRITMYRLVLYYLLSLWAVALVFGFTGLLPYRPLDLAVSAAVIIAVSWLTNKLFSSVFEAPVNVESVFITALILALIITPAKPPSLVGFPLLIWAGIWAMAAKYIFAIGKKHLFNPAAFAVALTALTLNQSASWWVGSRVMLPFVILGGILLVRKLIRFDLVLGFLGVALASILFFGISNGTGFFSILGKAVLDSPLMFFAFVTLTEPLTTPPTRGLRVAYGALVGLLFAPAVHIGSLYSTPELALIVGNVFSYVVSPKKKLILELRRKERIAPGIYDFVFESSRKFSFHPGQYLEWTLEHKKPDSRGNRRYFTVASSPTEEELRIGVKFNPEGSSFKNSLLALESGGRIVASQLAGDFTLPRDRKGKLVFVAGGIGITPFRSMLKYLSDRNDFRTVTVFYSNRTADEVVYRDILDEAENKLGVKTVYTLTVIESIPRNWKGYEGRIDAEMFMKEMPDYKERTFYVSGPRSFVVGVEEVLRGMGIPAKNVKTDFFPGFA